MEGEYGRGIARAGVSELEEGGYTVVWLGGVNRPVAQCEAWLLAVMNGGLGRREYKPRNFEEARWRQLGLASFWGR